MYSHSLWILICICGSGFTIEDLDPDICVQNGDNYGPVFRHAYCVVSRNDISLLCPPDKLIVLLPLQFATRPNDPVCTKRVLSAGNSFCCFPQDDDVVYDGNCMMDTWTSEDKQHYQQFMQNALKTCMNTSRCTLRSKLFSHLQRNIPSTRHYSSYFQVVQQCIEVPKIVVDVCSSKSVIGKEIHVRGDSKFQATSIKPCSCHIKQLGHGNITIKAVEVRTDSNELMLRSVNTVMKLSPGNMPLFGLNEIFTDNELDIIWRKNPSDGDDNLWLYLSGNNGEDINITCEDVTPVVQTTEQIKYQVTVKPTLKIQIVGATNKPFPKDPPAKSPSVTVNNGNDWEDYEELWPIIYAAAGAFLTMVPICGIVCGVLICRMGTRPRPNPRPVIRQRREDPGQYNGQYNSEYLQPQSYTDRESAIYDTLKSRMSRIQEDDQRSDNAPGCIHVQQRVTNPTPIPSSGPGQKNDTASSSLLSTTPGASYAVSEAESFQESSSPSNWEHQPTTIQIRGKNSNTYQNGQRSDSYLEPDYCEESNQLIASGYGPNTRSYFVLEGENHRS